MSPGVQNKSISGPTKRTYVPVGCAPPAFYRMGGLHDRDPLDRDPLGRNPTQTETPKDPLNRDPLDIHPHWTETPLGKRLLDRDPWTDTPGQRPSGQRLFWLDRHPRGQRLILVRDPLGQRPPWPEVPLYRDSCRTGTPWTKTTLTET